jgi:hypothetical protein
MATCPRCKGHLTDSHRCPRRPGAVAAEIVVAGLAGGFAGLMLVALVDPAGDLAHLDTVAVTVGAVAAIGLDRYLRS